MIKILMLIAMIAFAMPSRAQQDITIYFNASANQPNFSLYREMLDIANHMQSKYRFRLELKPGANGTLAIKAMDLAPETSLATTAPAFVENDRIGLIDAKKYEAISAQGDACWGLISTLGDSKKGIQSLAGAKSLVVGTTGPGNVTHVTVIMLAKRFGLDVTYVGFKSNQDALINMVGGHGVNITIERIASYANFREKNPRLQILGMACDRRHPDLPGVPTLAEQGIAAPTIFLATLANLEMPQQTRQEIGAILEAAQHRQGADRLMSVADLHPPRYQSPSLAPDKYFQRRVSDMQTYLLKYGSLIEASRSPKTN